MSFDTATFIERIDAFSAERGLDEALRPSLEEEAQLRRLFATDKANTRLQDPYVGLIDVFHAPISVRTTHARVVKDEADLRAKYVMPLPASKRRAEGSPSTVRDLAEFQKNWAIFTEGSLSQLFDWNNVIAAGGGVVACLSPLPDSAKKSKKAIRKFYHSEAYPISDVDLFLWGLTPEQAETKINMIYEAVRDSVPWDVTCVRTKHAITIYSQYPYRAVQIVLRLYTSPAEILAGFDIDATCCAYDGQRVWANPRALVAMMRQCNTVDMTRRSPSYEVRLSKYAARGFEIFVPELRREDVDPTIYERSVLRMRGLARLLILEELTNSRERDQFISHRRALRGRPADSRSNQRGTRRMRRYKNDLKDQSREVMQGSDYDTGLHIPYGPKWDAKQVEKVVYVTDLGMNSPFNPKNKDRRLHRHPAFFGTLAECIEDCCGCCPEPQDEEDRQLQQTEDEHNIRGRIVFIQENPGRQSISGSFNPIDEGEWSEQVYLDTSGKLFQAIAANDRNAVSVLLKDGVDVNHRDHVGRTPLHVAIMAMVPEIACDLIDAGARISARLGDGRTALHLAAQMDLLLVVRKLLERNAVNVEADRKAEREKAEAVTTKRSVPATTAGGTEGVKREEDDANSEDGWNICEADGSSKKVAEDNTPADEDNIPEDNEQGPDILDINAPDWDHRFTPLLYAVLLASETVVDELLASGESAGLGDTTKDTNSESRPIQPLRLALVREDKDIASRIAERLVQAGASSSAADSSLMTVLHHAVQLGNLELVWTLLRKDPNAIAALNFPSVTSYAVTNPVASAVARSDYAILAVLLAYGADLDLAPVDVQRAVSARTDLLHANSVAVCPVEVAIARYDDVVSLLIALGGLYDCGIKTARSVRFYRAVGPYSMTFLDWVRYAAQGLDASAKSSSLQNQSVPSDTIGDKSITSGWEAFLLDLFNQIEACKKADKKLQPPGPNLVAIADIKGYLDDIESLLVSHGAKTWDTLYPDTLAPSDAGEHLAKSSVDVTWGKPSHHSRYVFQRFESRRTPVDEHLSPLYDQLFEACFAGDNAKIQEMCLPAADSGSHPQALYVIAETEYENRFCRFDHPGCSLQQYRYAAGWTTFFAAISQRHWSTARLVLAIAVAQYRPGKDGKTFTLENIFLDEESDNESDGSCEYDHDNEGRGSTLVDVAKLPSQLFTQVPPNAILNEWFHWSGKDSTLHAGSVLHKAVYDDDLEAFIHISDLYKSLGIPLSEVEHVLCFILQEDRPEILDEYIRRSGDGVHLNASQVDVNGTSPLSKNIYPGLTVHGKKRKDLANPKAPRKTSAIPLLWRAAQVTALWPPTDSTSSSSDEKAMLLRQLDLEKELPALLGWAMNPLNESPLIAAVVGMQMKCVETLFKKSPEFMMTALNQRIKYIGYTPLLLAVHRNCEPELVDYLLERDACVSEVDTCRGWSIFHLLSEHGLNDLLEHVLNKLSPDVVQDLLKQPSKGSLVTPLHLAVKSGRIKTVKILLSRPTLFLKDVDGNTPLHIAAREGFAEITRLVLEAGGGFVLLAENSVGVTPLEMARQQYLCELRGKLQTTKATETRDDLDTYNAPIHPPRLDATRKANVTKLAETVATLEREGRLRKDTRLFNELVAFVEKMATRPRSEEIKQPVLNGKNPKDAKNHTLTLQSMLQAANKQGDHRSLTHVMDTRKSIEHELKSLPHHSSYQLAQEAPRDKYTLASEEDAENLERAQGLVFSLPSLRYGFGL